MKWEKTNVHRVLINKHEGKRFPENLDIDGTMLLKRILSRLGLI
jgi:hypothetical protein